MSIKVLQEYFLYLEESEKVSFALIIHSNQFLDRVAAGRIEVRIDRVFSIDEIVEAHTYMEFNQAKGKRVVLIQGSPS